MNIHYRLSQFFSIFSFVRSNSILAPKFVCTRIGRDKILYLILCLTFSMPINVKQRKGIAVDTIFCPTPIHASKPRQKKWDGGNTKQFQKKMIKTLKILWFLILIWRIN